MATSQAHADPRGSLWNRWDPHLHAPGTINNDLFGKDWTGYIDAINKSDPPIRALGITDYYSLDCYREVRKRHLAGELPGVTFVFPNVEVRINVATTDGDEINAHLLFSPRDEDHVEQIERVMSQVDWQFAGTYYQCNRAGLIALGKKHKSEIKDDRKAFEEGAKQFKFSYERLQELFKEDTWLRENCLVAISAAEGDGLSGLKTNGSYNATREELQRMAHIIFSGKPSDRVFWLGGASGEFRDEIEKKYQGLKPCLHGCDAHSVAEVGRPKLNRYCWIKGDLTFETLRQTVIDPEVRVAIGEDAPALPAPSLVLTNIRPIGTPWLKNPSIPLNGGLVAVIGARGSGKTALVDLIAAGAQALPAKLSDSSFLKRATSDQDLIGNARVEETWGNGDKRESNFGPAEFDFVEPEPEVRYLSQQFVDDLCSSSGIATALREEIERVIFDQTEKTQRYDTTSFAALASLSQEPILFRRRELADSIADFSKEIAAEERWIEQLSGLKDQHAKLKAVLANRKIELGKLLPKGMEARTKRLLALDEACTAAESRIETLNKRLRAIKNLRAALDLETKTEEPSRFAKLQRQYADAGLTVPQWQTLKRVYAGDTGAALDASKAEATAAIDVIEKGDPTKPVNIAVTAIADWHLGALRTEREKVKKEVGIDGEQQRKYDLLTKTIATEDAQLKTLAANVTTAEGAKARKEALIQSRRETFQSLFETFIEEAAALATLYAPLHDQLKGATGALARLRFTVKRVIDLPKWLEAGKELLDLRKTTIFDLPPAGHASVFGPLETAWRTGTAAEVATAMAGFFEKHGPAIVKAMPGTVQIDDRIDWRRQLGEWLFSLDHVTIEYALEYDGTNVEQLSPGARGIVLLLLYLAVDRNDPRPLLIDQPEENLDPKSVFEDLVPHFREARKRRQVIIVTHNANLVVNTDADQVIVARSSRSAGGGLPDIEYTMGSLENDIIRHAACDILEGGKRAFIERERRYRLQWERMLEEDAPSAKSAQATQPVRPAVDRVDLYFAYGSNLLREQMTDRCKEHKVLGRATLPNYKWIINRRSVANVVAESGIVEGTLYKLSVKDEARLDELEGVHTGAYKKEYLDIQWQGKTVRALVYIDPITELGKASAAYAAILTQGSVDAGLPKEYFDGVIRPFLPATEEAPP